VWDSVGRSVFQPFPQERCRRLVLWPWLQIGFNGFFFSAAAAAATASPSSLVLYAYRACEI
jgi:hypothetical protein